MVARRAIARNPYRNGPYGRSTMMKRPYAKAGYKKRSYGLRSRVNTNLGKRQINVFRHPFSTATVASKIPDGRATLSSGQRHQLLSTITVPIEKGSIFIACIPGFRATVGSTGDVSGVQPAMVTSVQTTQTWVFPAYQTDVQCAAEKVAELRIVSCAIKLSLVNNSDENDGFWEAIRVPFRAGSKPPVMLPANVQADGNADLQNADYEFAVLSMESLSDASFIDSPSYCNGKLRDIHKYIFQSKPSGKDHEFQDANNAFDPSFDAVLIKISGRTGASTLNPTKLVCHSVSNQEVSYLSYSPLARFQNECVYESGFDAFNHAAAVDVKAATKVYTTS